MGSPGRRFESRKFIKEDEERMDCFNPRDKRLRWLNIDRNTLVKLGLLASLGVLLLVAGQFVKKPGPDSMSQATDRGTSGSGGSVAPLPGIAVPVAGTGYQVALEQQLGTTLSSIKGVGEVVVQVSLEAERTVSYATNSQEETRNSQEREASGLTRSVQELRTEAQVVMAREGGSEKPIVSGETLPAVRGVLVVAEGASDPTIKERLSQAVQVLLDLPAHKVMVLEKEGGK
jgi:stage III sporulation protein AG